MLSLQRLRECRTIVRCMLVWFCMSMGVAIASPVVYPQALTLVCTTAGAVKLVAFADTEQSTPTAMAHTLDCVLCLCAGAPPVAGISVAVALDLTQTYRPAYLAPLVWRTAEPTSARDPPHLC